MLIIGISIKIPLAKPVTVTQLSINTSDKSIPTSKVFSDIAFFLDYSLL